MDKRRFVRLEVVEPVLREVMLVGYYLLEPNDKDSWFRTVDDYLFSLSPHKVTYYSEEHHALCSRYCFRHGLISAKLRRFFLLASLSVDKLPHRHRLEVEMQLNRMEASYRTCDAGDFGHDRRSEMPIEGTQGYWAYLMGR